MEAIVYTVYKPPPSSIFSVEEQHSQNKNFNFSFLLFKIEGIQTRVIESNDSDIKELMTSAVPESTKKSPKYCRAARLAKGNETLKKLKSNTGTVVLISLVFEP